MRTHLCGDINANACELVCDYDRAGHVCNMLNELRTHTEAGQGRPAYVVYVSVGQRNLYAHRSLCTRAPIAARVNTVRVCVLKHVLGKRTHTRLCVIDFPPKKYA